MTNTDTTSPLPDDVKGYAYVRFGRDDARGRRPFRMYGVPLAMDGEKQEVHSVDLDPYKDRFPLHMDVVIDDVTGLLRIARHFGRSTRAPAAWGVAVDSSAKFGDGMRSMVLFATDRFTDGTIIDEMQFTTLGIDNSTQVGAVIWSRHDGTVSNLYVHPDHRRNNLGRKVLRFARAHHGAHGWPGQIHGDGRRTALGQAFVGSVRRTQLVAPHTELSPPMDPD